MKKFTYALMASCAMLFSFSSCEGLMGGGDDDDNTTTYGYADVKVTETENAITFSYKLKGNAITAEQWAGIPNKSLKCEIGKKKSTLSTHQQN